MHQAKALLDSARCNESRSNVCRQTHAKIQSTYNAFNTNLTFSILDKITEFLPNVSINPQLVEIPQNLKLADPGHFKPGPIDILLGANIFWDLLCVGQVKTNNLGPILQKTHLGWILSVPSRRSFSKYHHNRSHWPFYSELAFQAKCAGIRQWDMRHGWKTS